MKIVKCSCSRNIHIFSQEDNAICIFCNNPIRANDAIDNSYIEPFLFLNDRLSEIDTLIASENFDDARNLINGVLEIAPGMKIELPNRGVLPNSGEVHWRKLLAEVGCKNDKELLNKGKSLDQYPAFNNAEKYANDIEKSIYSSIKERKELVSAELIKALDKQELNEKQEKRPDISLTEFQNELDDLKRCTQNKLLKLEEIEKKIHEQRIDYMTTIGESGNFFVATLSEIKGVGNKNGDISLEERDHWIEQLDEWLMRISHEANNLEDIKSDNVYALEYFKLKSQQEKIVSEIKLEISKINDLQSKTSKFLEKINPITEDYIKAISDIENGSYIHAINLISQTRFDEIVKQVKSETKPGDN